MSGAVDRDNIIAGNYGDDTIYGSNGVNILYGEAGNDSLYGGSNNDTIIGGKGNDYLRGGYGNDTYIFSKGDGKDTIYDEDSTEGNLDTIRFGAGIKPADLIFKYVNNNLQISQHGSTDSVTVNSWQYGRSYQIENVRTANGSMITNTQVDKLIQAMATFQHDTGMSWEQALKSQPSKVQTILQDYWTIPSA